MAFDLGVVVDTTFFSSTNHRTNGLTITMCISNYGARMKFEGTDLLQPINLYPYEAGNYAFTEGEFRTPGWELPLIFRIGAAVHPIAWARKRLTLKVDALHPDDNSESINLSAKYRYTIPSFSEFYLPSGYKGLSMVDSQHGTTFSGGIQ